MFAQTYLGRQHPHTTHPRAEPRAGPFLLWGVPRATRPRHSAPAPHASPNSLRPIPASPRRGATTRRLFPNPLPTELAYSLSQSGGKAVLDRDSVVILCVVTTETIPETRQALVSRAPKGLRWGPPHRAPGRAKRLPREGLPDRRRVLQRLPSRSRHQPPKLFRHQCHPQRPATPPFRDQSRLRHFRPWARPFRRLGLVEGRIPPLAFPQQSRRHSIYRQRSEPAFALCPDPPPPSWACRFRSET